MRIDDFRCRITSNSEIFEITNRSDLGVGYMFVYKNILYNNFVREFHRRLIFYKKSIKYETGNKSYYWTTFVLAVLATIVVPFNLSSYQDHIYFGICVYLSAVIGLFVSLKRLRPKNYLPQNIPDELLPLEVNRKGFIA